MLRLPQDTPIKKILAETLKPTVSRPGRKKTHYWQIILEELNTLNFYGNYEEILQQAQDRVLWNSRVNHLKRVRRV